MRHTAVAIIPARGGSKRIPGKNIKDFCGKPIIAYSIEAALKSELFDRVIVSTDSEDIAVVAAGYGASISHRPPELADDHTGTQAVMKYELEVIRAHGDQAVEMACCIYPTAPFIAPADLMRGREALERNPYAAFAFSVASYEFPIQRALRVNSDGSLTPYHPEHRDTRSQDLPVAYHDAGQWYWGRVQSFLEGVVLYSDRSMGVAIPRHRVQDIDTIEDWIRAELMYVAMHRGDLTLEQHRAILARPLVTVEQYMDVHKVNFYDETKQMTRDQWDKLKRNADEQAYFNSRESGV